MQLKKWELVLVILALISIGIWVIGHTVGLRASNREGVFQRIARPSIAFWPEPIDVEIRIDAGDLPVCTTTTIPEPIYAILVLDNSGSMAGIPMREARNASSDFADLMNLTEEGDAVAVVRFDDEAELMSAFSQERRDVVQAIQQIVDGGGTEIAAGLDMAREEFLRNPPPENVRSVIILLSDGQSNAAAAISAADQAKAQGIRIITIALGDARGDTLLQIASSEADYYETADPAILIDIYSEIASGFVGSAATDVVITEYFNNENFELSGDLYRAEQNGNRINWQIPFVGQRGRSIGYTLLPQGLGWYTVSPTAGQMSLLDCNQQALAQATPDGPRVLVLFPVWLLYIFPLIALIWLLYRLWQAMKPAPSKKVAAPEHRSGTSREPKETKKPPKGASVSHGRAANRKK